MVKVDTLQDDFYTDEFQEEDDEAMNEIHNMCRDRNSYDLQDFADYLQGYSTTFLKYVQKEIYNPIIEQVKSVKLRHALLVTRQIRVDKTIGSSRHKKGQCPVTGYKRKLTEKIRIQNKHFSRCSKEGGRVVRAIVRLRRFLIRHKAVHKDLNDDKFTVIHEQFIHLRNDLYINPKG